jgi:amidohydrolase
MEVTLDVNELKAAISSEIDNRRHELQELSQKIHDHPELGLQETKAAAWLSGYLKENGFSTEEGICGLETAFRATYGKGKPVIAILAEYDALPKIGHACGHNLIASSAVGAGIAAKRAVDSYGGSVQVLGTPGEEGQGGKVILVRGGAFDGVDIAMMVHPGVRDTAVTHFLALHALDVEFFGKSAHAAARPDEGINALEAMIQSFVAINSLRQHIKEKARIHGIITDSGEAPNIVPAHSAGSFIVRAENDEYLDELKERVLNCFRSGATASGARMEYKWHDVRYSAMRSNRVLAELYCQNMTAAGREMPLEDPENRFGSSDMGNVSQAVPSIHPAIAIAPLNVLGHSPEFAEAAVSERGAQGMIDAAKAMAMTAVDLLADTITVTRAWEELKKI